LSTKVDVATSLITIEFGRIRVSVLLILGMTDLLENSGASGNASQENKAPSGAIWNETLALSGLRVTGTQISESRLQSELKYPRIPGNPGDPSEVRLGNVGANGIRKLGMVR
jgi:hypothetical protein